jgi:TPR repeat protein
MAYEEGLGVGQDFSKAAALYRKAADQGADAAAYFLAKLFLEGKGVAKDATAAVKSFITSARAGNTGAQGVLLALYMYGEGAPVNVQEAYFLALLAAREKHPLALQLIPDIASTLTSQRRAEIEQRVRDWKPTVMSPERSTASVRPKQSSAMEAFAEEIESWPADQARAAQQLIKATVNGDGDEIDRLCGELTVGQFRAVTAVLIKMKQGG